MSASVVDCKPLTAQACQVLKCEDKDIFLTAPVRVYKANPKATQWENTGVFGALTLHWNKEFGCVIIKIVDINVCLYLEIYFPMIYSYQLLTVILNFYRRILCI